MVDHDHFLLEYLKKKKVLSSSSARELSAWWSRDRREGESLPEFLVRQRIFEAEAARAASDLLVLYGRYEDPRYLFVKGGYRKLRAILSGTMKPTPMDEEEAVAERSRGDAGDSRGGAGRYGCEEDPFGEDSIGGSRAGGSAVGGAVAGAVSSSGVDWDIDSHRIVIRPEDSFSRLPRDLSDLDSVSRYFPHGVGGGDRSSMARGDSRAGDPRSRTWSNANSVSGPSSSEAPAAVPSPGPVAVSTGYSMSTPPTPIPPPPPPPPPTPTPTPTPHAGAGSIPGSTAGGVAPVVGKGLVGGNAVRGGGGERTTESESEAGPGAVWIPPGFTKTALGRPRTRGGGGGYEGGPAEELPETSEKVRPGLQLGRCLLTRRLDEDGRFLLFQATHLTLKVPVKVQLLRPELGRTQPRLIERFRRHAERLNALNHRNIVRMFDFEQEEHVAYMILEHQEGLNLRELVGQSGRLTMDRAVSILIPILEGLSEAGRLGLVHGAIDTEAILIPNDGPPKLGNFPIFPAEETNRPFDELRAWHVAPEVRGGIPADQASDLYSLGMAFLHMILGELPFDRPNIARLFRHFKAIGWDDPEFLNELLWFRDPLDGLIADDPDARFATYGQALTAFRTRLEAERTMEKSAMVRGLTGAEDPEGSNGRSLWGRLQGWLKGDAGGD